jgi:hypothetical protein
MKKLIKLMKITSSKFKVINKFYKDFKIEIIKEIK